MVDQIKLTVVATGFDETKRKLKDLTTRVEVSEFREDVKHQQEVNNEIPPEQDEWDIPAFLRQGKN